MGNMKGVVGASSPARNTADGGFMVQRMLRDASSVKADWLLAMAMEGRVFGVNVGTGSSPTTFTATTYAAATPDLWVHVPAGTTIIPVYLSVAFEDTGTAQVVDVLAIASATGDSAVTGTALTVYNLRMDAPLTTNCTATAVVTSAGTDPHAGNRLEFWRPYAGFADDAFNSSIPWRVGNFHGAKWSVGDVGVPPVIVGAGSLAMYCIAQAGIGFLVAYWVEIPSNSIV